MDVSEYKVDESKEVAEGVVSATVPAALSRSELLLANAKKPWKIPTIVPRGYTIPIAITSKEFEPQKGKFVRLGYDIVVNGTWLALKWAIEENNNEAVAALKKLILDWPFDFIFFDGDQDVIEGKMLKWMINIPVSVERLRDFCGLGGNNLMRIVSEVRKILQRRSASSATMPAKEVYYWVLYPGNIQ